MKTISVLIAMLTFSTAHAVDPAKMQEMMKKSEAAAMPGAAHKQLADLVGNWNYTSKMWMSANAKPEESTGKSTMKMLLGGRWLRQELKGKAMGMPFEGMGLIGYDNVTSKYQTLWFDTMSTGVMKGTGTFDAATKTLKDSGSYSCPMTGGERDYHAEMKLVDKNNFVYSLYSKGMDESEPEFKMMEVTYKRAK